MNNERLMVIRNKIENVGLEDCGVDGGLVAEIIDELIDSRHWIESLAAERDQLISDIRDVFSDDWCLLEELKNLSRCDLLQPYAAAHRLLAIVGAAK